MGQPERTVSPATGFEWGLMALGAFVAIAAVVNALGCEGKNTLGKVVGVKPTICQSVQDR